MADQQTQAAVRRTSFKLVLGAVAMFAFVFVVMVPLYNALCDVLGLNGKTNGERYRVVEASVDTSREIKVRFAASNNEDMSWGFRPQTGMVVVNPGAATTINYIATNPEERSMVGQAIPSIVPSEAAPYFHKTECFCFNQQPLEAGKSAELGLQFIVDRDLPAHIQSITLSYTIFDVTDRVSTDPDLAAR